MKYAFLALVVFLSTVCHTGHSVPVPHTVSSLLDDATAWRLANETQWKRFLKYKKRLLGGFESMADADEFFLSPDGKRDPVAELKANVRAFFQTPSEKEPAACKFPARYAWLKKELAISTPGPSCPKFWEFREAVAAKSATLVFSSYYLNNPASAFGHSFLRLNKADGAQDGKRYELLDNGVNYAAVVTQENPVLYAIYGLTGMFKGTFTRMPYYYKVREYNDLESRDLWDYDLNLTPEQVERLVAHVWELGSTHFDYYYLSENCAYHILTTIEAAAPEIDLTSKLSYVVIPAETIKAAASVPGFVKRIAYRPSLRVQFAKRYEELNYRQSNALATVAFDRDLSAIPVEWSNEEKRGVLDAAIDHVDLSDFKALHEFPDGPAAQWKQRLLVARSQVPVVSAPFSREFPQNEIPHSGHDIARVGVEGGATSTGRAFASVRSRLALHDLLDPSTGYPVHSQIEFFNSDWRIFLPSAGQGASVRLEDFTLFRVVSLNPMHRFSLKPSWRVRLAATRLYDEGCRNCLVGFFELGGGFTWEPAPWMTTYLLGETEVAMSRGLETGFARLAAGPTLGVRFGISPMIKVGAFSGYRYQLFVREPNRWQAGIEARLGVGHDFALNARTSFVSGYLENGVGLYYYF